MDDSPSPKPVGAPRWALPILVFVAALAVRLLYLLEYSRSPFFGYLGLDSARYQEMARAFVEGRWPIPEAFFWPPLYPLFLGGIDKIVFIGDGTLSVLAPRLAQALLGSLTPLLVWLAARRAFGGTAVPLLASLFVALNGTMTFFDAELLPASLDTFLQLAALLLLLEAGSRGGLLWWLAAGLTAGLSAANRGGILLFMPAVLLWTWMLSRGAWPAPVSAGERTGRPRFLPAAAALATGTALVLVPLVRHNLLYDRLAPGTAAEAAEAGGGSLKRLVRGDFVAIALSGAVNLALGNRPDMPETLDPNHPRCFVAFDDFYRDMRERGGPTASGRSRYLRREMLRAIARDPAGFLRLAGAKILRSLNGVEIPRNANLYAFAAESRVLGAILWKRWLAFPSGLVIPLGLLGLGLALRDWRRHFLLVSFAGAQWLFLVSFYPADRFRLPLLAVLSVFAASALAALPGAWRAAGSRGRLALASALAGLFLLSHLPIVEVRREHGYWEWYHLGNHLAGEGRLDEAEAAWLKVLEINPVWGGAQRNLAVLAMWRGRPEEAERWSREARESGKGDRFIFD